MGFVALLHLAAGAGLAVAAWLMPRHIARCRTGHPAALLLDMAPLGLGALLLAFAAGRPLFAGLIILMLGAGFTLADYTMRRTLREPTVFSEMSELPQVFTHPQLYLPFAGPGLVIGGAVATVLVALALLVVEPPLWAPRPLTGLTATALIGVGGWLLGREPLLGMTAGLMRRLRPSGEPFADAEALGPFGMIIVHAIIARGERRARQQAMAPPPLPATSTAIRRRVREPAVPVILVQCESFFDARRLSPQIPRALLAGFDACVAEAALHGRFGVPGWGANTMRAEFAVLSGIPDSELGYDRFNPYYALARVPIESQVWRLRRAGYKTMCLHPFDRRFFRRDLAMPGLGFEEFLCRRDLGGPRRPPYCPDPELGEQILKTLDREGPGSFIFAITMGNHGPWLPDGPPIDSEVAAMCAAAALPEDGELRRYLDGLRRSDAMLQLLRDGLDRRGLPAVLAFYGDHLPSLGNAFGHFGFEELDSDYVVWPAAGVPAQRRDLKAHELGRLIVDAVLGVPAAAASAVGAQPAVDLGACLALR
ncbi:MAG: LTA synthase family protein [Thiohalocapsa sp.]